MFAIHACHNDENVWKSIRFKTHMRFTSRSYTNIKSVSPSFRHKMRSGRVAALLPSAAIRRIDSGRVTRSWPILSHVRLFGFGKHRALSLELEPSRERSAKPQLKNAIFGSKLSFLGVHYIVLQYILIASFASRGKLRAESLFTPPLQRLKHVWLPCASLRIRYWKKSILINPDQ